MFQRKSSVEIIGLCFGIALLAMAIPGAAYAAASKVSVCHMEGNEMGINGAYHLIDVSEFAVMAHRRHGDALVGEPVPGDTSMVFGADCTPEVPTPVVAPGYSNLTEEGSVRLRQTNSGGEIYLGKSDLGVGINRNEANCTWGNATYTVSFSFDGVDRISTTTNAPCGAVTDWTITPTCNTGGWNTMDVLVVDRSPTTGIAFESVDLNGNSLGNFGSFDLLGTPGFQNWTITAFDFTQPWTIAGNLVIEGFSGSAELNKLQLTVGCLP